MFIYQITATFDLAIWIPLISIIISIIMNIGTIAKVRQENKEKMATKGYVLDQVSKSDASIVNLTATVDKNKDTLDSTIAEHKADNIREHGDIKREFHNVAKGIDDKLNIVIGFIEKTG